MSNKKTRKEYILSYLKKHKDGQTCVEMAKAIIKEEKITGTVAHYLPGSLSSILHKLVKEGVLKYSDKTGPKGGHIYLINEQNNNK